MKKLFLVILSVFLLSSCVTTKLVEYNADGDCVPTLAGHQQVEDLQSKNPDEKYYWICCQWVTESQRVLLVKETLDRIKL